MKSLFLALIVISSPVFAGKSTSALPALFALGIEGTLEMQAKLCTSRLPDNAELWANAISRFKKANAQQLEKISTVITSLGIQKGKSIQSPANPASPKALLASNIILMSVSNAAYELAMTNDAKPVCNNWLDRIKENGKLENSLPLAVEQAKTLVSESSGG